MLTTDMTGLKYVAVEIIRSPGTKLADVECGAFMGIVTTKNNAGIEATFVVRQNSEKSVRVYNTIEYGVLTIQAESEEMKYMTIFTRNDKEEALTILRNLVQTMKEESRLFSVTPGNELINVDLYKGMPKSVLEGNNLSSCYSSTGSQDTTHNNSTYSQNTTTYTETGTTTYVVPKPEPLAFKRKGKLPGQERLDKMRELVLALNNNTAVVTVPTPRCDLPKKDEMTSTDTESHTQTT